MLNLLIEISIFQPTILLLPSIILLAIDITSSALIALVSIINASSAGTKGDVFLLLSDKSLFVISFIKDCNIHSSSFPCKKDMFFSKSLLFALISTEALIKNLKFALGKILVPISRPSNIQPPYFSLLILANSICFKLSVCLRLGRDAIFEDRAATS